MNGLKIVKENFNYEIKEVTLLSMREYEKYKGSIPLLKKCWWLRSPGNGDGDYVFLDGRVFEYSNLDYFGDIDVRPALKIKVSSTESFKVCDKLDLLNKKWTILDYSEDELYVLCDTCVYNYIFSGEPSGWNMSMLKQWLEQIWVKSQMRNAKY